MKRVGVLWAAAALLVFAQGAWAQVYSADSFAEMLRELDHSVDASAQRTRESLPALWRVRTAEGEFSIGTEPLMERLREPSTGAAHRWIAQLQSHLDQMDISVRGDEAGARAAMAEILQRPEFHQDRELNALQRWVQQVESLILSWFGKLLRFASAHPAASMVFFWGLITVAMVTILALLLRRWRNEGPEPTMPAGPASETPLRSWQEWLRDARAAATRADYREAIRCAYWAGVTRIMEDRPARIRYTDTPRERLHSLAQQYRKSAPLAADQMESFRRITARLERYFYARQPANADNVTESFKDLESFGCKTD